MSDRNKMKLRGWWRILRILAFLFAAWLTSWVAARILIVRAELPSADGLVILSGSSTYLERTEWAVRLYKEGRAPIIILTNDNIEGGWSVAEQRNLMFIELAAAELQRKAVPAEKIERIPEIASGTYEEAKLSREFAVARKLRSIIVVTSPYHSRRALSTWRRVFEGSGIEIGLETPPPGIQSPSPATWWLHSLGWEMVPGEYVKMIYYRIKH